MIGLGKLDRPITWTLLGCHRREREWGRKGETATESSVKRQQETHTHTHTHIYRRSLGTTGRAECKMVMVQLVLATEYVARHGIFRAFSGIKLYQAGARSSGHGYTTQG